MTELPEVGSYIYVEQVSPTRAFVGCVKMIWLNEFNRKVIAVVDDNGDIINLSPDDRWVPHNADQKRKQETPIAPFSGLGFWFDPGTEYVQDEE